MLYQIPFPSSLPAATAVATLAFVLACSSTSSTLMMEAAGSSKTSVHIY
jgi:ABC-type Fe3+ transport system permease subunit